MSSSRSSRTIPIEHVTIRSAKSFDDVRAKLEMLAPRIDARIFQLAESGDSAGTLQALEALPKLTIFTERNHGGLLVIAGLKRRSIQYEIGNPLTASKMSRHVLSASMYAPIRVLLREDGDVAFEVDRPLSLFAQFENGAVDAVARQLDQDLIELLETAAT